MDFLLRPYSSLVSKEILAILNTLLVTHELMNIESQRAKQQQDTSEITQTSTLKVRGVQWLA